MPIRPATNWALATAPLLRRAAACVYRRVPHQAVGGLRQPGIRFLRKCPTLRTRVPLSQFSAIQTGRRTPRNNAAASAGSIGFKETDGNEEEEEEDEDTGNKEEELTWSERWQCARCILRPWRTGVQVMEPAELRSSIIAFSGHAGLLYALMAGIATTGVFLGESPGVSESGAAAAVTLAATATEAASILSNFAFCETLLDVTADFIGRRLDSFELAAAAKTPLFISSVFWCLHGLLGSMQTIGRIMAVPESRVKQFVAQNSFTLHTTGWFLIPGVSTLGGGIVCATHQLHGEPVTSFAFVGLVSLGLYAFHGVFSLGFSTEKLNLLERKRRAALQGKTVQTQDILKGEEENHSDESSRTSAEK